ncbi:MAG TPA: alpha/beta fold hydrolase [Acetobacteraceae bacterium]|nr:alpha/beta fold hydrolase [Acetobacteraceae bacterium]
MDAIPRTPEAFVAANGLRLCTDSFGDPAAPKLLLIMGLGAQMTLWDDDFCAGLAQRGFHVIRFDNRDIGRSTYIDAPAKIDFPALLMAQAQGKPIAAPYLLRDMANDAAGLLDALNIEAAHIVGASMGGMIAQELAIHAPRRVRSLVSIMSTTGHPGLPGPSAEAAAVLLAPPPLTRADYVAQFQRAWKVLRAGSFPEDEARDAARAGGFYDRGLNPAGVARQLLAIFASGDRTAGLATVRAPTLVIHGDVDPLVPLEAGRATAAAVPGAKMLTVPGMGHALPMPVWPAVIDAIATHCV